MIRVIFYTAVILIVGVFSVPAQLPKEVMTPPADSADRENLRIWVPVERSNRCRLTLNILSREGKVIRHLVDFLIGPGYYNFYWDKRDDSGHYVNEEEYTWEINDCGKRKQGRIQVSYKRWERLSRLAMDEDARGFELELMADSAPVTIEWYGPDDSLGATTVSDTILMKGVHNFSWRADGSAKGIKTDSVLSGRRFIQKVIVGDYVYTDTVRFAR